MEVFDTIYKKDSSGKIRYLNIFTDRGILYQKSGVFGTSNPILHSKVCKAKNIGKSNEVSAIYQAHREAFALVKDKLTKGYFTTPEEAESTEVILPMLAKEYKAGKIDFSKAVYIQPKLDGMRCLKLKDELVSRAGKKVSTMPHIESEFIDVPWYLDGELYAHGLDFQSNMELVKKYRPGESEEIKYHIYDVVLHGKTFTERHQFLVELFDKIHNRNCVLVETKLVLSDADIQHWHDYFLSLGYEGSIVRIGDAVYDVNKRSSNLLKFKYFRDIALPIKDVLPCKNKSEWGEPIFDWSGAEGHRAGKDILGCNTKMSHEQRIDLLKNKHKYIGKTAEVRFFEYSNKGVPRFPLMVGFRLDK